MKNILLVSLVAALSALFAYPAEIPAGVVDVTTLGAKNDGSADVSAIVNAATEKTALFFPPGRYLVAEPLHLRHSIYGKGFSRCPDKAKGDPLVDSTRTWFISNIECNDASKSIVEFGEFRNINVEEINFMCHSRENAVRVLPGKPGNYAFLSKLGIYQLGGTGISIECSGSRPIFVQDICIWGTRKYYCEGNRGLLVRAADCRLSNIEVMATQIGIEVSGGYTYGENMHLWTGCMAKSGDKAKWWKGTRGIKCASMAAFVGSNIYPDTCYYPFEFKGKSSIVDIRGIMYWDDRSEHGCPDHNGALLKCDEGVDPCLKIDGGFWGVCGSDADPHWMKYLYNPKLDIRNVTVRSRMKIKGANLDTLCMNTTLPDYRVSYATNAFCKVAEIFTTEKTGSCEATLTLDDGAVWKLSFLKTADSAAKMTATPLNELCAGRELKAVDGDGTLKVFLKAGSKFNARFTTIRMTPRFRPVDFGNLRTHGGEVRYRECLSLVIEAGDDLARAQSEARKAARSGLEVTIRLAPRVYRLERPLEISDADSRVTWEGADGATISGAAKLGAWHKEADGMWSAAVPFACTEPLNTLFVNGARRPRSRWPKGDRLFTVKGGFWDQAAKKTIYHYPQDRIIFQKGELDPAWTGLDDALFSVYHLWVNTHLRIKSIDTVSNVVTFVNPSLAALYKPGWDDPRWYLENLRAVATEPGEWCHAVREGRVYYRPKPGETIAGTIGEVPRLEKLLSVSAKNVTFRNVRFTGCRYALPAGDVNNQQAAERVTPAVEVRDGKNVVFDRCVFEDLDGYALGFYGATCDSSARGCRFNRLGAGGVKISVRGSFSENKRVTEEDIEAVPASRTDRACRGNEVSDCEISWFGLTYRNAVGVLVMHADHTRITRNHIHDGWYSGISVGWTWGYMPTVAHHNEISYNHIHDIGKGCLSDMGGIYTLGISPGTVLRGNVIHGVSAYSYGAHGIYHDEGSAYILDEDNLVYDTGSGLFNVHYGRELTVRNNIFAFGKVSMINAGRDEDHVSVRFYGNIVYGTTESPYSQSWLFDREYPVDYGPKPRLKKIPCKQHADADWNVIYLTERSEAEARFGGKKNLTLAEWRQRGFDVHSVFADPLFVDPANRDFRLKPDSPALKLGFRPIDLSSVGLRK